MKPLPRTPYWVIVDILAREDWVHELGMTPAQAVRRMNTLTGREVAEEEVGQAAITVLETITLHHLTPEADRSFDGLLEVILFGLHGVHPNTDPELTTKDRSLAVRIRGELQALLPAPVPEPA